MNDELRKAITEQISKIESMLWDLNDLVNDKDEEKQRISMLVWGVPDMHIKNESLYEKGIKWANPKYKPYTTDVWMMQGMLGGGDIRERLPSFWVDAPEPKELPDGLKYLEK